jgi:hypothetical protein
MGVRDEGKSRNLLAGWIVAGFLRIVRNCLQMVVLWSIRGHSRRVKLYLKILLFAWGTLSSRFSGRVAY